jgi:hypothetical protein
MKSEVKQLVWEHIWAGEYKQAMAILGEFEGDTEAEELIVKVKGMIYAEGKIYTDEGLYRDKNKEHPKKPARKKEALWRRLLVNPIFYLTTFVNIRHRDRWGPRWW